jgi:hypothetical protein
VDAALSVLAAKGEPDDVVARAGKTLIGERR